MPAENDIKYMRRAIELAGQGLGSVSPNPLVGCVVVGDDKIIGESWHKSFGGPHAEVNAIASVSDPSLLESATVYVNLEPCAHFGKTPPCADLLIEKRVRRVVVANRDTHPEVSGKGIAKLISAGIEVTEDILKEEALKLNRRFFTRIAENIPYVILKWAESADGYFAPSNPGKVWISTSLSRQRVHQWRSEEDAVLVGTNTAAVDNPKLNVRDWTGRNPLRVVIDRSLKLQPQLHLFDQEQPTICYNLLRDEKKGNLNYIELPEKNFLHALLQNLLTHNIGSIIVEGGAQTLHAFLEAGHWHEARVFRSPSSLGEGMPAPSLKGHIEKVDGSSGDFLTVWTNPAKIKNG